MLNRDEFCFLSFLTKGVAGETLILVSGVWGGWSDPLFRLLFNDLLFVLCLDYVQNANKHIDYSFE